MYRFVFLFHGLLSNVYYIDIIPFHIFRFQRFWNWLSIYFTYLYSYIFHSVKTSAAPFAISIEPTSQCNLQCRECPTGTNSLTRSVGEMPIALFEKIISDIYKKTFYLNLYFQGEPLLNKNLSYFIEYAHRHGMYTVLSTNAQLLTPAWAQMLVQSKLSKIIISLDGFSQQSYAAYRKGGNVELVKQGIANMVTAKEELHSTTPAIIVQVLVNRYNENEIPLIEKWIKHIGKVHLKKKSMQLYSDFEFLPENKHFRRYKLKNGTWVLKKYHSKGCFRIWSQCVVTYNGDVLPCCYDKNGDYTVGNLSQNSLNKIWHSDLFNRFRKNTWSKNNNLAICNNCIK